MAGYNGVILLHQKTIILIYNKWTPENVYVNAVEISQGKAQKIVFDGKDGSLSEIVEFNATESSQSLVGKVIGINHQKVTKIGFHTQYIFIS